MAAQEEDVEAGTVLEVVEAASIQGAAEEGAGAIDLI